MNLSVTYFDARIFSTSGQKYISRRGSVSQAEDRVMFVIQLLRQLPVETQYYKSADEDKFT